jgi:non-ribosomal peptide synthetase component F
MKGATVCIPSDESRINDLAGAINTLQANHICLTPSVIEFLDPAKIRTVKTVVLAGEVMSISQRNRWCDRNLVNGFGPTETSVTAAINSMVTKETDCRDIGLPVGGRCWVVNPQDHDMLVPIGELHLDILDVLWVE